MTQEEVDNKIIELSDEQFLVKLTEVSRLYGWYGDYIEISSFIRDLFIMTGKPVPELEPYETE